MLKFIFLTEKFYEDYKTCTEIEQKINRPYTMVLATINDIDFAIPMRSNIKHNNVLWTDKFNNCGLDLSKAIVLSNKELYIDKINEPRIRQNEFNKLKGKEYIVKTKLESYIRKYSKAYNNVHIKRNEILCRFSTLQYFHEYIFCDNDEK